MTINSNALVPLTGGHEVPPMTKINPQGSAPMMIACDHASNRVPESLNGLGVPTELLELHIAYDIGARQVAMMLAEKFNACLLCANYSRLVIDLNRHFDDPAMFPEISDGHQIHGNRKISEQEKARRIEALFHPYHLEHGEMVQALKTVFAKPIILSVHSFTEHMNDFDRPWHFGVLWDQDEKLARQLLENFDAVRSADEPSLVVGDNEPYRASEPLGYSLVEHAAEQSVEMALIEIRQDLIRNSAGQRWAADIIYRVVQPLLDYRPATEPG